MSPASAGNLEVERYIGACLISHNKSSAARNEHFVHQHIGRDPTDIYHQQHHQHVNYHVQRCHQSSEGWAGGMPLISFATHQRRGHHHHQEEHSSLARLAVHTQGAPLILSKSFNHRKNKVNRNNEGANAKKPINKCQQLNSADAVSVTSDESSGSANSETCLPRIIKPRKRRKKDRKPPLLGRPSSLDGFSTDSPSPDIDNTHQPFGGAFFASSYSNYRPPESSPKLIDRCHILGDISETPQLHHSFEDVQEPDDGKDINGNQSMSTCQCRYCDPSGQIWDVDRDCYSPFLTPPNSHKKTFQFPNLNLITPYSSSSSVSSANCLEQYMSSISLEDDEKMPARSSLSSCRDLEVSTEIVTSLNGHRDLEIKFFSSSCGVDCVSKMAPETCQTRCDVNSERRRPAFVSEE